MTVAEQDLRPLWSQGAAIAAECDRPTSQNVRLRRLVVDQPGLQLATDVHPNLTVVVVPSGQVERVQQLVSAALGVSEPGVHVELTDGQGRHLLLFRPHGGRSRVLDLDTQLEALPPVLARASTDDRWTPTMPESCPVPAAEVVMRLSAVHQPTLWDAAAQLTEVLGRDPGDAEAGRDGEGSADRRGARRRARRTGLGRRTHRGRDVRPDPTADAARAAWRTVAGDVPLGTALGLRGAIEACAVARSRTVALAAVSARPSATDASEKADVPAEPTPVTLVAEVLATVFSEPADTPQTLILPPGSGAGAGVQLLLDVLPDLLGGRQVLVVTCDPDVADWGRLEALAGHATSAQARSRHHN